MTTYITTLVTLGVIDAVWLFSTAGFYKTKLGHLFADKPNLIPAVIFYLIYTAGLVHFVINPALKSGFNWMQILGAGAFFGLIAYATYDLTNNATMKDWPVLITVLDIVWGMVLTGVVSLIVVWIPRF